MTDSTDKTSLRKQLRQWRRSLEPDRRHAAALAAAANLQRLPEWQAARSVAVYIAADGELDPQPVITACRESGRDVLLPVILEDRSLAFRAWDGEPLQANRLGIPEPPATAARREVSDLDLMLMPLVGWKRNGARLGMGGGFYDRTLADSSPGSPLRIGYAYAGQECPALAADAWDIRMDWVVTELAIIECRHPEQG